MATIDALKSALRAVAKVSHPPVEQRPLSDAETIAGYNLVVRGERETYREFVGPQLCTLVGALARSRGSLSVLEITPGPQSVLCLLPLELRSRVARYTAFEPSKSFAAELLEVLGHRNGKSNNNNNNNNNNAPEPPRVLFPHLQHPPDIRETPFALNADFPRHDRFDVVLFGHGMYGMKPRPLLLRQALGMLSDDHGDAPMVVVFHRDNVALRGPLRVCQRTERFAAGLVAVAKGGDEKAPDADKGNEALDRFAAFVAGFAVDSPVLRAQWRGLCRDMSYPGSPFRNEIVFGSPARMAVFTRRATPLLAPPELVEPLLELAYLVPLVLGDLPVKNRHARRLRPAAVARPAEVFQVSCTVRWAVKHGLSLTVIGGGHSGHCVAPGVVAVDMSALKRIEIFKSVEDGEEEEQEDVDILVEAGCTTGEIISAAMTAGVSVPLGSRPSVGAGLWLQGGIGHLARIHGLACDAIKSAIVVEVQTGSVICVGPVPIHCKPPLTRPAETAAMNDDMLWAIKGAGTHMFIVVSIIFKTCPAPKYSVRNWIVPLGDEREAQQRIGKFDALVARTLPRNFSADAVIFSEAGKLQIGITVTESNTEFLTFGTDTHRALDGMLGPDSATTVVDGVGVLDTGMYMGAAVRGGVKTTSFKRCVFLKHVNASVVTRALLSAIKSRPSPLCYLHLIQGGQAIGQVAADATAFGCRDWDFACVVTGVWPRGDDDNDRTDAAEAAEDWVYNAVNTLLPISQGAYSADLGPDPRDAPLVVRAFGPNLRRLARIKSHLDPHNTLAYTCLRLKTPKLVILVTGESGAGKDYCAAIWAERLTNAYNNPQRRLKTRVASISDAFKREYATATGADYDRLLADRSYKEQHRAAMDALFRDQIQQRPALPAERFQDVVYGNADVDVLLVTGMRDAAPVAAFAHLVCHSRVVDICVTAAKETRLARRGRGARSQNNSVDNPICIDDEPMRIDDDDDSPASMRDNAAAAKSFAAAQLLPLLHDDLARLAGMVASTRGFPRAGVAFRNVLGVARTPGGIPLAATLLQRHLFLSSGGAGAVVAPEAGGFVFAAALVMQLDPHFELPLVAVRAAGRLPPPTVSVDKPESHVSSNGSGGGGGGNGGRVRGRLEMEQDAVPAGVKVVVIDDVLASGRTLCAVLQLLQKAGVDMERVSVLVVAEFPLHRGRELLRQHGFGRVSVTSLLVYGG
ncbi:phosphoribosyl transferase domain protein, partial [Lasiosphaeria ovina]